MLLQADSTEEGRASYPMKSTIVNRIMSRRMNRRSMETRTVKFSKCKHNGKIAGNKADGQYVARNDANEQCIDVSICKAIGQYVARNKANGQCFDVSICRITDCGMKTWQDNAFGRSALCEQHLFKHMCGLNLGPSSMPIKGDEIEVYLHKAQKPGFYIGEVIHIKDRCSTVYFLELGEEQILDLHDGDVEHPGETTYWAYRFQRRLLKTKNGGDDRLFAKIQKYKSYLLAGVDQNWTKQRQIHARNAFLNLYQWSPTNTNACDPYFPRLTQNIGELMEARFFVVSHLLDEGFWAAVNANKHADLRMPNALRRAIDVARNNDVVYFFKSGFYVAPSGVVPQVDGRVEYGLFSLLFFLPKEFMGPWLGNWLWKTCAGYKRSPHSKRAYSLSQYSNYSMIKKYGMQYIAQNGVEALVDSCWGKEELDMNLVKEFNSPFCLINEPAPGLVANCESISHVNSLEKDIRLRYSLWVVTGLPVLPNEEFLIHYGASYDRDYLVGDMCPEVFDCPVRCSLVEGCPM